ncbi:MAG TPA: hypothetical protein VLF17_01100 [Candidatus Nitrosotenuis sp.]|nr:hypothetical protein [Candidatus Nitrosotenuis sp.]
MTLGHAFGENSNAKQIQALENKVKGETPTALNETRKIAQDTAVNTMAKTLQHEKTVMADKTAKLEAKPYVMATEQKQVAQLRDQITNASSYVVAHSQRPGSTMTTAVESQHLEAVKKQAYASQSKAEHLKDKTHSKLGEIKKMTQMPTTTTSLNKSNETANWKNTVKKTLPPLKYG